MGKGGGTYFPVIYQEILGAGLSEGSMHRGSAEYERGGAGFQREDNRLGKCLAIAE